MAEFAKEVLSINIEDELRQSYLDYAMSVIVGRALPDIRDGLKPVHRRVLFAMHELSNDWNKPYKKSARVVGDVIGKYHPHGDTAVYDTIVRMAQPFSMRYMLVDGQGNFGSIDGDSPAAMRYTEVRMARFAHSLLLDLEKETVDFSPNYDGTELVPNVLPTRIPNLLVNGSAGIAVGMATNIPPHNLTEVINACLALIDNPHLSIDELMAYIPAPDFPTAGLINGRAGIIQAYRTGRGRAVMRGRVSVEDNEKSGKQALIITELPYQVNKARLIEKIAELVKEKRIEGITALRDESDKDGMRIVIELRRGELTDVVLNNLYAHTQLQSVFGINIVALDCGQPRTLNLKQLLEAFLQHRREVITRRTHYELRKARERAHLLEGLAVALANLDAIVDLIKKAPTPADAREQLIAQVWQPGPIVALLKAAGEDEETINQRISKAGYQLSSEQAQAILDLRLHRLTGLEQDKIHKEYEQILEDIKELRSILASMEKLLSIVKQELIEVKEQFGDERRTEILESEEDLTLEDLITEEDMVITLSQEGYVKCQPVSVYQAQHRGGKGKSATALKDEDTVVQLWVANSHDMLLCFSDHGKLYWLKAYQLPQAGRNARGRPFVNILPLAEGESISTILPIKEFDAKHSVFMATKNGVVKKVSLEEFSRPRSSGIIAINLDENDALIGAALTHGDNDVMLFTSGGKAIRFHEDDVRQMGRSAHGVRGVKMKEGVVVIALVVVQPEADILIATENGYGKRTMVEEFRPIGRGGQGVIAIQTSERNGMAVGAIQVLPTEDVVLLTNKGALIRTKVSEISQVGRNAQGVRLIRLSEGEKLAALRRIDVSLEEESEGAISAEIEIIPGEIDEIQDETEE